MIIVTTDQIEGYSVSKVIGLVKGSTIQTKHIGRDILSSLKGLVGGEITAYNEMMNDARELALQRMMDEAKEKGANAIVGLRMSTTSVMDTAAEIIVYGTAVFVQKTQIHKNNAFA